MDRRIRSLLITTLVAFSAVALAAIAWLHRTTGVLTCTRCGAELARTEVGPFSNDVEKAPAPGRTWFEHECGPCARHAWERTGCWTSHGFRGVMIGCTRNRDGHALHELCASLTDRLLARDIAHRFDALTPAAQHAAFDAANSSLSDARLRPSDIDAHLRTELSRAGWPDLAARVPASHR